MITKEAELLFIFAKEPWKKYTFTELKKISGKKSKSYLQSFVKKFVKEGILLQEKVGHLPIYSINLSSSKARNYAGFTLEHDGWNRKNIPFRDMQELMNKINYNGYIFIITGSYAKGTQTKNSDIDVVILIEDALEPKSVYAELKLRSELNIPRIHLYVFKNSEFIQMLTNNKANYGKEIVKNLIVLTEGQIYLKIIEEAIKNGFNYKSLN
jgi:predicted nucleotidyltransferase